MTTPSDGVKALIAVRDKIARLEIELDEAKAEKLRLERIELPPLFLAARVVKIELPNGAQAKKDQYAYARLAKSGPARQAMLDWLVSVREDDAIKAVVTASWGKGEYEVAKVFYESIRRDARAKVTLEEDVHWRSLERIVLEQVKRGAAVPLDEIGATFGDHVTITKNPVDPSIDN